MKGDYTLAPFAPRLGRIESHKPKERPMQWTIKEFVGSNKDAILRRANSPDDLVHFAKQHGGLKKTQMRAFKTALLKVGVDRTTVDKVDFEIFTLPVSEEYCTAIEPHLRSLIADKLVEWAASCAEHVLPLFEKERTKDTRPGRAIEVAYQLGRGYGVARGASRAAESCKAQAAQLAALAAATAAFASDELKDAYWCERNVGNPNRDDIGLEDVDKSLASARRTAIEASAYAIAALVASGGSEDAERSWQIGVIPR